MKKEYLQIGKIVGTHGVRGMVRIDPWADDGAFLKGFKTFFTDQNGGGALTLNKITPHGNVVIAAIDGVNCIEDAEKLRHQVLYIKRDDANLPDGKYFIDEIIGAKVYDNEGQKPLGTLTDVIKTGANDVWQITKDERDYLVPVIADINAKVDIENDTVYLTPLKGIFDDED